MLQYYPSICDISVNIQELLGRRISQNMEENEKISKNIQEYARIYKNRQEDVKYERIWKKNPAGILKKNWNVSRKSRPMDLETGVTGVTGVGVINHFHRLFRISKTEPFETRRRRRRQKRNVK